MPTNGLRVIEDSSMVDTVEDWSGVRSPSRAARRLRKGLRKKPVPVKAVPKTTVYQIAGALVMHPAVASALREKTKLA